MAQHTDTYVIHNVNKYGIIKSNLLNCSNQCLKSVPLYKLTSVEHQNYGIYLQFVQWSDQTV